MVTSKYPELVSVRAVKVLTGFRVHLVFSDGLEKDIDLEPYLWGPVFEPIRNDPQVFASVHIDEHGDTIAWDNGADIAPETLYYEGPPPWVQAETKPRKKSKTRVRARVTKKTRARVAPARPTRRPMRARKVKTNAAG